MSTELAMRDAGVLDFEEHGDPRSDADTDDLVAVLSAFGIEHSSEGAELAEHWAAWRDGMSAGPLREETASIATGCPTRTTTRF
jgi:hypothetical protein